MLTDNQIERYSRQLLLPDMNGAAQSNLLASGVLVLGSGCLAETVASYLGRAGVGLLLVSSNSLRIDNPDTRVVHGADLSTSLSQVDAAVVAAAITEADAQQILRSGVPTWLIGTNSSPQILGPLRDHSTGQWCSACVARIPGFECNRLWSDVSALVLAGISSLAVLRNLVGLSAAATSTLVDLARDQLISSVPVEGCPHHGLEATNRN